MEQLRPCPPLGRPVKGRAVGLFFCLWGWPATLWAHASAFVLAKCSPAESGEVSLELTVDYRQHPILTGQEAAVAALREVLQVETPQGPVPLETIVSGTVRFETAMDPDLPLPREPGEAETSHALAVVRYQWTPEVREVKFSVPRGNPHDVLFWLSGKARAPGEPAPWRILIAGDTTPPIPLALPVAVERNLALRWGVALGGMGLPLLAVLLIRRRLALSPGRKTA